VRQGKVVVFLEPSDGRLSGYPAFVPAKRSPLGEAVVSGNMVALWGQGVGQDAIQQSISQAFGNRLSGVAQDAIVTPTSEGRRRICVKYEVLDTPPTTEAVAVGRSQYPDSGDFTFEASGPLIIEGQWHEESDYSGEEVPLTEGSWRVLVFAKNRDKAKTEVRYVFWPAYLPDQPEILPLEVTSGFLAVAGPELATDIEPTDAFHETISGAKSSIGFFVPREHFEDWRSRTSELLDEITNSGFSVAYGRTLATNGQLFSIEGPWRARATDFEIDVRVGGEPTPTSRDRVQCSVRVNRSCIIDVFSGQAYQHVGSITLPAGIWRLTADSIRSLRGKRLLSAVFQPATVVEAPETVAITPDNEAGKSAVELRARFRLYCETGDMHAALPAPAALIEI
jgi:hypothetical protein